MFEYTLLVDFGLMMWPILFHLLASYLLQHKSVSAGGGGGGGGGGGVKCWQPRNRLATSPRHIPASHQTDCWKWFPWNPKVNVIHLTEH